MKILVLAPQPFYQERGTPIAVDLMVRSLAARGHAVDLLVYHEGEDRAYAGVRLHRIPRLGLIRRVRPGFSVAKLVCDWFLFWKALGLVRRQRPDVIHAVEEAAFMAWIFRRCFGIPYIYDMDSSLPDQLTDALPVLRPLRPLLRRTIKPIVASALLVAPVCEALAESIRAYQPQRVVLLHDVSLLGEPLDAQPAPAGGGAP